MEYIKVLFKNHEQSTKVIWSLLKLFFGWQMSCLLVALHQTSSNSWAEIWGKIILTTIDIAAVNEGSDGVDLLSSRLTTSRSWSGKVNTGHARILSHGEGWIWFGNIDVEAFRSAGIQTASLLRKAGGANVMIQELSKLHDHAAHSLVRIVTFRKCSSNHANVGQVISRPGASGTKVLRVLRSSQATEWNICCSPTWILYNVAPSVYSWIWWRKVTRRWLLQTCPQLYFYFQLVIIVGWIKTAWQPQELTIIAPVVFSILIVVVCDFFRMI